jgi:dGTPase
MTHTLEVAQIGRRLAQKFGREYQEDQLLAAGGLDPEVVEAAALVHDLGHPPFGHVAEKELQDQLEQYSSVLPGSFEGNAQSFRIVTKLAVHRASPDDVDPSQNYPGINLSRAALNAALKYPWQRAGESHPHRNRKWGVYETEKGDFEWARRAFPPTPEARTLEADLMDWADDVAYSVHDLEDFYRAGLIPLDRLARDAGDERLRFWERYTSRLKREREQDKELVDAEFEESLTNQETAFIELMDTIEELFYISEPFDGSRRYRGYLRNMTSNLIDRYVNAVSRRDSPSETGCWIQANHDLHRQVRVLKGLTWEYVIDGPALASQQAGQRRIIKQLFDTFVTAAGKEENWKVFPLPYQEELRTPVGADNPEVAKLRTVVDFIASMTEAQALRVYQRITGYSPGSVLGPY